MIIVFLGPPGAGKGTQAVRLAEHLGLLHVSTGDMLRANIEAGTIIGQEAQKFILEGRLAPDDLVVRMVKDHLSQQSTGGAVLDGFPRTLVQAQALDRELCQLPCQVTAVVQLVVETEELRQRLQGRGRHDDSPETVRERLEVYRQQTEPLVAYYAARSLLDAVNGMGTEDQVFKRICDALARREGFAREL